MSNFEADLKKFHKLTLDKLERVQRESAFDMFSSIVMMTPVDTGLLRGNWFAAIGAPNRNIADTKDPSASETLTRIEYTLKDSTYKKDIYFTNNLPYASRIEYDGHSAKAPEGMVRINLARWASIVENNAKKV